jgi:hypothetical protein
VVSRSANRSAAVPLAGSSFNKGDSVFVFLDTSAPGVSVRFFLDGRQVRTEIKAPWDLGGGGDTSASPYVLNLSPGSHTVRAVLARPDGTTFDTSATFTVAVPAPTGSLKYSTSSNRSSATSLHGSAIAKNSSVYIFLDTSEAATKVEFLLDGARRQIEALAPWDFAGGGTPTANPYKVSVSKGSHTVTAKLTRSNGTTATFVATFTVT